nr:hypothetical protein [Sphingomonas sp.]
MLEIEVIQVPGVAIGTASGGAQAGVGVDHRCPGRPPCSRDQRARGIRDDLRERCDRIAPLATTEHPAHGDQVADHPCIGIEAQRRRVLHQHHSLAPRAQPADRRLQSGLQRDRAFLRILQRKVRRPERRQHDGRDLRVRGDIGKGSALKREALGPMATPVGRIGRIAVQRRAGGLGELTERQPRLARTRRHAGRDRAAMAVPDDDDACLVGGGRQHADVEVAQRRRAIGRQAGVRLRHPSLGGKGPCLSGQTLRQAAQQVNPGPDPGNRQRDAEIPDQHRAFTQHPAAQGLFNKAPGQDAQPQRQRDEENGRRALPAQYAVEVKDGPVPQIE